MKNHSFIVILIAYPKPLAARALAAVSDGFRIGHKLFLNPESEVESSGFPELLADEDRARCFLDR
jgi:hypothetical protein